MYFIIFAPLKMTIKNTFQKHIVYVVQVMKTYNFFRLLASDPIKVTMLTNNK